MGTHDFQMTVLQLSAVHEMANIGLGNATTALSTMTGRSFGMSIPRIDSVPIETVSEWLGGPEALTIGSLMPFEGDLFGFVALLFPFSSACGLWKMLIGSAPEGMADIGELEASAMLEVGNIVNSSFLNAIAAMTELTMHATPPMVSADLAASVLSSIVAEAEEREAVALAIEMSFYDEGGETTGFFLCLPTVEGLQLLFKRLGISEAA